MQARPSTSAESIDLMPITRSGYAEQTRNGSTRAYRKARAITLANATHCAICGNPLGNEPTEADHIVPHADNGSSDPSNLQAVHRSCNRKRGRAPIVDNEENEDVGADH